MNEKRDPGGPASGLRRKRSRRLVPALIVLLVAAGVAVVASIPAAKPPLKPAEVPPVDVRVMQVQPEPKVPDSIHLPAVVEANRVINVAAEVAGRIERIAAEEGREVRAGELIVQLNKDLLQADYDRAKATAEYDQREYERMAELLKRDLATPAEHDQARTKAAASKAELDAAQARLDRSDIYAPINGFLEDLTVELGEYVKAGDPVARIVDIDTAKVVADVPERDVPYFSVGALEQVIFQLRGQERELPGTILYIGELADPKTRTSRVEIEVKNPQHLLRSGQIVGAVLTRRVLEDVIMVPLGVVIPLESGKAVYVVEDGKAQRREVELGLIKGTNVQVLPGGLRAGDLLVVSGQRLVAPGQPVNIIQGLPATQPAGSLAPGPTSQPASQPGE